MDCERSSPSPRPGGPAARGVWWTARNNRQPAARGRHRARGHERRSPLRRRPGEGRDGPLHRRWTAICSAARPGSVRSRSPTTSAGSWNVEAPDGSRHARPDLGEKVYRSPGPLRHDHRQRRHGPLRRAVLVALRRDDDGTSASGSSGSGARTATESHPSIGAPSPSSGSGLRPRRVGRRGADRRRRMPPAGGRWRAPADPGLLARRSRWILANWSSIRAAGLVPLRRSATSAVSWPSATA